MVPTLVATFDDDLLYVLKCEVSGGQVGVSYTGKANFVGFMKAVIDIKVQGSRRSDRCCPEGWLFQETNNKLSTSEVTKILKIVLTPSKCPSIYS